MAKNSWEEVDDANANQNEVSLKEREMELQERISIRSCKRKRATGNIENIGEAVCGWNNRCKTYGLLGNCKRAEYAVGSKYGAPLHLPCHHYHYGIEAEVRYGAIPSDRFSHLSSASTTLEYKLNRTEQKLDLYKQKFDQAMKDLDKLKGVMKSLSEEKGQILSEKDQLADNLKKTEEILDCYKDRANQLAELLSEHAKLKNELECVIGEKNQLSEDKDKTENELKIAQEKVKQLNDLQPHLYKAKDELKNVKSEASKEIMTMTQVLKHKENAFNKFVEEFSTTKVDTKIYCLDDCFHCLICMEPLTQSEIFEHNMCSLACGHFFGRSCITNWITQHSSDHSSKCPICQKMTTLEDIRNH